VPFGNIKTNILAVEHDVIPLDGADVFQQGGIDSIGDRVRTGSGLGRSLRSERIGPAARCAIGRC
jgi:hypothetical protein